MRKLWKIINIGLIPKLLLWLWCFFTLFAFFWIFLTSLKDNREFFSNLWGLPASPSFASYALIWVRNNLNLAFLNSLIIVSLSVLCIAVVCTPAAYILARIPFRLNKPFRGLFILGMGIPYQLLIIPLAFILYQMKLTDTFIGLIVVYISLSIPFSIFLIQGFFKSLPHQLEEAAYIDGCSPKKTFVYIMLPLGRPGIITASIFNFIWLWNEFLLVLTLVSDTDKYTISMGLYALFGSMQYTGDWVGLFAGFVMATVPTLVVYFFLSKQIIQGMTMGAIKE